MCSDATRWCPAYVGIGSNLDSPKDHVLTAIDELKSLSDSVVTGVSSLYRSAPMGPADQDDYINAAAAILTQLSPHDFFSRLCTIEFSHGRKREGERWGPRTLDLDLLVFGASQLDDDVLTVPHPGIGDRNFVLLPLNELAPHLIVPGLGSVASLTDTILRSGKRIEKIQDELT